MGWISFKSLHCVINVLQVLDYKTFVWMKPETSLCLPFFMILLHPSCPSSSCTFSVWTGNSWFIPWFFWLRVKKKAEQSASSLSRGSHPKKSFLFSILSFNLYTIQRIQVWLVCMFFISFQLWQERRLSDTVTYKVLRLMTPVKVCRCLPLFPMSLCKI